MHLQTLESKDSFMVPGLIRARAPPKKLKTLMQTAFPGYEFQVSTHARINKYEHCKLGDVLVGMHEGQLFCGRARHFFHVDTNDLVAVECWELISKDGNSSRWAMRDVVDLYFFDEVAYAAIWRADVNEATVIIHRSFR